MSGCAFTRARVALYLAVTIKSEYPGCARQFRRSAGAAQAHRLPRGWRLTARKSRPARSSRRAPPHRPTARCAERMSHIMSDVANVRSPMRDGAATRTPAATCQRTCAYDCTTRRYERARRPLTAQGLTRHPRHRASIERPVAFSLSRITNVTSAQRTGSVNAQDRPPSRE